MAADPNADLIGFTFTHDFGLATVTGSMPGMPSYVNLDFSRDGVKIGEGAQVAAYIRPKKRAEESEAKRTAALWARDARP